jgi:hypothetical protein
MATRTWRCEEWRVCNELFEEGDRDALLFFVIFPPCLLSSLSLCLATYLSRKKVMDGWMDGWMDGKRTQVPQPKRT